MSIDEQIGRVCVLILLCHVIPLTNVLIIQPHGVSSGKCAFFSKNIQPSDKWRITTLGYLCHLQNIKF